jgi:predicted NBD/HSP70 family sugar kinase
MQFVPGTNLPRVKRSNYASILQVIYHCGPLKRGEIAQRLELTLPTITNNINHMIASGVVQEVGSPEPAPGYPGRRARLVDIVPDSHYFIGVEMQGYRRVVCVLDFRGRTLYTRKDETPESDYTRNMELSCAMVRQALEDCHIPPARLAGLGFCVPGLVDHGAGVLLNCTGYQWRDRSIRSDVAAMTGCSVPISVENNACARAYGARLYRQELRREVETFAYLFIGNGIACPLVLNSLSNFGSVVGAGEVGHMVLEPDGLPCSCGNRGCLETYASNLAVIARCEEALVQGSAPLLRRHCPPGVPVTMEAILSAQADGDPAVCQIVQHAVQKLGIAVANIQNFASPGVLLIEGELFRNQDNQRHLLDVVHRNLCSVVRTDTQFLFVEPDPFSGARGAAALAICKTLDLGGGLG